MTHYLDESFDLSASSLIPAIDELPLWSSYFGAVLLDRVPLKNNTRILDIGCGTGFPLIEVAQRSGSGSKVYGIDPWGTAINRIKEKMRLMSIKNVEVTEGTAESLPFENDFFDTIVSNNGINNVTDSSKVMKEAFRVLKEQGKLIFTVNLPGTMKEFYNVFRETLRQYGFADEVVLLENHIYSKRKTLQMNIEMITGAGLKIDDIFTSDFRMRYVDGTALLNHFFIKLAFLDSWKNILPLEHRKSFFSSVEKSLNTQAESKGEISLTIPFACFSCRKEF